MADPLGDETGDGDYAYPLAGDFQPRRRAVRSRARDDRAERLECTLHDQDGRDNQWLEHDVGLVSCEHPGIRRLSARG